MTELGYLVFFDQKSGIFAENSLNTSLRKLGFQKDKESRLLSSIMQVVSYLNKQNGMKGIFVYLEEENDSDYFCCRFDREHAPVIEDTPLKLKDGNTILIKHSNGSIILKYTLPRPVTDIKILMEIRDLLSSTYPKENFPAIHGLTEEINVLKSIIERTESTKLDFFSNVSHEIRTPLNAIMGMSYILEKTQLTKEQEEVLEKIISTSQQLNIIVQNALNLSRIKSGKMEVKKITFPKEFIMTKLKNNIVSACDQKQLKLMSYIDPEIPEYLYGDPYKILALLEFYADNAIKFSDAGTIRLNAMLLSKNEKDCEVRFEVSDEGIGLDATEKEKLFMGISQLESSATRKYGGIGIGLNLVREISQHLYGEIGVDSVPGAGSTFWFAISFSIPFVRKKAEPKILLVEDNLLNQMIMKEMLKDMYIVPEIAANGKEAVKMTEEKEYDLILMDVQMPVMDGLQASSLIRKNKSYDLIPIVAATASTARENIKECLLSGMNDYILKPILHKELHFTLLKWLPESPLKTRLLLLYVDDFSTEIRKEELIQSLTNQNQKKKADVMSAPSEKMTPSDPVLDLEKGLGRLMNNEKLYRNLVQNFFLDYDQFPQTLETLLQQQKRDEALIFSHTLKGLCGTLGAARLQNTMKSIESELKKELSEETRIKLLELIPSLVTEKEALKDSLALEGFFTTPSSRVDNENHDPSSDSLPKGTTFELTSFLTSLKEAARLQKPKECKKILNQYSGFHWEREIDQHLTTIIQLVNKYHYKEAIDLIEQIQTTSKEI